MPGAISIGPCAGVIGTKAKLITSCMEVVKDQEFPQIKAADNQRERAGTPSPGAGRHSPIIETISKVKEDHRDEFLTFSRTLLSSIGGIKSAFGSEGFVREVKYIQKNQVDAGISDVEKTVKKIQTRGTWQKGAILTGLVGIDIAVFLGAPVTTVATGLAASGVAMIAAKIAQLKDHGELKAKSPYFLWELEQKAVLG